MNIFHSSLHGGGGGGLYKPPRPLEALSQAKWQPAWAWKGLQGMSALKLSATLL